MMMGPEPRMRILEMSVRLGIEVSCRWSVASKISSFDSQIVFVHHVDDCLLVAEYGAVNPGVPRFISDDFVGALWADQLAVGFDFEIAIHQVAVSAIGGVGAFGQSDGSVGIHLSQLGDGGFL